MREQVLAVQREPDGGGGGGEAGGGGGGGGGTFSVTVCNAGEGLDRHPLRAAAPAAALLRRACARVDGVPAARVADGALWYLLLRPLARPADAGGPAALYGAVLPALAAPPARAAGAAAEGAASAAWDWMAPPADGDPTHAHCRFGPALR